MAALRAGLLLALSASQVACQECTEGAVCSNSLLQRADSRSKLHEELRDDSACANDDAAIAQLAQRHGYPGINGCQDAAFKCAEQSRVGDKVRSLCCQTCSCTDDDAEIARLAAAQGIPAISGCIDAAPACTRTDAAGDATRRVCCVTCSSGGVPESSLPPADPEDPVQLFLLGGQSECVGSADAQLLQQDSATYPELVDTQDGVWFAGYSYPVGSDRFFIRPLKAGEEKTKGFGPEVSFGQRVRAVTGARVLMVKYCVGGTNVHTQWNPRTTKNKWSSAADDGSADWLLHNGGVDFSDKEAQYVNWIYTARRAAEALTAAGVAFEWKGIVWVQGDADKANTWQQFGEDTAYVWGAARRHLGVPALPVVDSGSGVKHNLRTGKAHAEQVVPGGKAFNVEFAMASADPTSSCVPGPSNPCLDSIFLNADVFNHYGWDPNVPASLKPPGASSATFRWWKAFPNNQHTEYEGMVLKGRMLADKYIQAFTQVPLPAPMAAEDPALLFPWPPCASGQMPSSTNQCWVDERAR
mmetsp:Transcript_50346/g.155637  ORF Transcript_50346/g.155637 Transcript_50346/m.155637 type:complete len:527 (+) Transcript_50346:60-1640(+)